MKAVQQEVQQRFPGIITTCCSAHCLDLLLNDIGKVFAVPIGEATRLASMIRNRRKLRKLVKQFQSAKGCEGQIVAVVPTRWWSTFDCITSLLVAKRAITKVARLQYHLPKSKQLMNSEMIDVVLNEGFWSALSNLRLICEPIAEVLPCLESDCSTISDIIHAISRINHDLAEQCSRCDKQEIRNAISALHMRYDFIETCSMHCAYLLDPRYKGEYLPSSTRDAVSRFAVNQTHDASVLSSIDDFLNCRSSFSGSEIWTTESTTRISPYVWWKSFGNASPVLSKLARKLFSVPASSASSERVWSACGFIHSDVRNKLGSQKALQAAFVYKNLQLEVPEKVKHWIPAFTGESDADYSNKSEPSDDSSD